MAIASIVLQWKFSQNTLRKMFNPPVRGGRAGDVSNREPETLLHRHEEAGQEEAPEGHQEASEPLPRALLRHFRVAQVSVKIYILKFWQSCLGLQKLTNKPEVCKNYKKNCLAVRIEWVNQSAWTISFKVWDCHLCADLPQHGVHGDWALRPVQGRDVCLGDLQRPLYNHL